MTNTIVKDILRILNDPDVKLNRGKELKSEADLQSFAATKAKSLGLTTDELKTLMNSAYIYLPYVTKFVTEQEGDDLTTLSIALEESMYGFLSGFNAGSGKDTGEFKNLLNFASKFNTAFPMPKNSSLRTFRTAFFSDFVIVDLESFIFISKRVAS